jgi:hypothetical protein
MNLKPTELWNAWRTSAELQQTAEAWITRPTGSWTQDDDQWYSLLHSDPDRLLVAIFAVMQLTDDPRVFGGLAAGPFEDFLGIHGEKYLEAIHALAMEHRRLREVLDGVWQGAMPKHVWHRIEILKQSSVRR